MTRELKIMNRVAEHYAALEAAIKRNNWDCKILGLFLQGSQNYNLDEYSEEYMSDIDTKAIVVPGLRSLTYGKTYSEVIELENKEHIEVKDLKTIIAQWEKQNTSYIELLFTDFKLINPEYENAFKELYELREDIARLHPARHALALMGGAHNKFKAMLNPTPDKQEVFDKFGYNPKELCGLIRYHDELVKYINGYESYKDCLVADEKQTEYLMRVKKGSKYSLEEAKTIGESIDKSTKELTDSYTQVAEPYNKLCSEELYLILENTIRETLVKELLK